MPGLGNADLRGLTQDGKLLMWNQVVFPDSPILDAFVYSRPKRFLNVIGGGGRGTEAVQYTSVCPPVNGMAIKYGMVVSR